MNATAANTITEMTNLLGTAAYDVEWNYRSSFDATADLMKNTYFAACCAGHFTIARLIETARTEGEAATRKAVTDLLVDAFGPIPA